MFCPLEKPKSLFLSETIYFQQVGVLPYYVFPARETKIGILSAERGRSQVGHMIVNLTIFSQTTFELNYL